MKTEIQKTGNESDRTYGRERLLLFFFMGITLGLMGQLYMERNFRIYDEALRFHIRAASEEHRDQRQKLLVRDALLEKMKGEVSRAKNRRELEERLRQRADILCQTVENILENAGEEKEASLYFTRERFPLRIYGQVIFPAGEYRALRVDIGEAKGHNWWCAIYPELCYNAEESMLLSEKGRQDMKKMMTERERSILAGEKTRGAAGFWRWLSGWLESAAQQEKTGQ